MATLDEPLFRAKLEAWRHKMVDIFHFLRCDMVLGIVNPLAWTFHAISNEKRCPISMPFLSTYIDVSEDTKFFPARRILIGQFKFPARQPYARKWMLFGTRQKLEHSSDIEIQSHGQNIERVSSFCYLEVMYKSNRSFNIPPGHTPGIWNLFLRGTDHHSLPDFNREGLGKLWD